MLTPRPVVLHYHRLVVLHYHRLEVLHYHRLVVLHYHSLVVLHYHSLITFWFCWGELKLFFPQIWFIFITSHMLWSIFFVHYLWAAGHKCVLNRIFSGKLFHFHSIKYKRQSKSKYWSFPATNLPYERNLNINKTFRLKWFI